MANNRINDIGKTSPDVASANNVMRSKEPSSKRKWIFRTIALLVVIVVAVLMFIIGRGHTVYFDNVKIDYDGKTIDAPYKITVKVGDEQVAKLYEKERGMTTTMGQNFSMTLDITDKKDGDSRAVKVNMSLPYSIDGIVINLPALLAGAPEEVYLSEFISTATETEGDDEEVIIDEFEMPLEDESSDEG